MTRCAALMLLALASAACSQSHSPAASPPPRHVFVIVMENHSVEEALSGAFTASLAQQYGVAMNYHAVAHPSVPNYLALSSGTTWGLSDDSYHVLPKNDLGTQLTKAHVSWRAYMEGLTDSGCLDSPLPYDPGHNPFAYYGGQCPSNVVPLTNLASDLSGAAPRFVWITPDMCHDTHNCRVSVGDSWLQQEVGLITASPAWKSAGVLFITWDEDDGSADNQVLTLVVAQGVSHRSSSRRYTHYSLLATVEDLLGVGRLGQAAGAPAMTDLVS
jgi:phosphatidylinositol-3-phosphatase